VRPGVDELGQLVPRPTMATGLMASTLRSSA